MLPLVVAVIGDVGQPHPILPVDGEVTLDRFVLLGRPWPVSRAPAGRGRTDSLLAAQPRNSILAGSVRGSFMLVGLETATEPEVARLSIDERVKQTGVFLVSIQHRLGLPFEEPLTGEPEHLSDIRHGNTVNGKVADQREPYFGSVSVAKYAEARHRIAFSISYRRIRRYEMDEFVLLRSDETVPDLVFDLGLGQPTLQRRLRDPKIGNNLRTRCATS